ncbi:hypothetical protein SDC9_177001 [bioreactor metagenome]|uniref:Uncharacterized protein n=1 Tax=bioreactor metagenome TaxID=1076179 RepID=A0A645GRR6_9ZZZZ
MEFAHLRCQCRLIADGRRHPAQKGRHFRTRLGEAEDIVDKEENILPRFVTEIFRHGEAGKGNTHSGSRWFIHLAIDQGSFI